MREDGAPTPQESTLFGVHSSMKPQPVMQKERCRGGKGSQPPKIVGSQEAINHNSKVEKLIQKQDTCSVFVEQACTSSQETIIKQGTDLK